jgi:predicted oxidoreductase
MNVSNIIAGCMHWGKWGQHFNTNQYATLISSCIDNKITTFDHADIYGDYTTEAEFGKALQQINCRNKIQLITKCGIQLITPNRPTHIIKSYNLTAAHIIASAEKSLSNFNTDYIDVLLLHRPDILLHQNEIGEAFTKLKNEGKVLAFGVSNFTVSQMSLLKNVFPIAYNQIEISPLAIEPFANGQLDYCLQHKIQPMAWSPMASGTIFKNIHINTAVEKLAIQYNVTKEEIVYAWLLKHPANIIPITGSSKMERVQQATNALTIKLTNEDWYVVYSAALGTEVA